jgi:integrase
LSLPVASLSLIHALEQTPQQPRARMKDYGDGAVYLRKGSPRYWIRYSAGGKEQRESSKSTDEKVAKRLLKRRLAEVQAGTFVAGARSLDFDGLVDILKADYALNEKKTGARVDRILQHVRAEFGFHKAVNITSVALARYATDRKAAGAANATVLLELSLLRSAFNMAIRLGVLAAAPLFPEIDVSTNARQGVLTHAEVEALTAELPPELRGAVWVAFYTGWRLKSDVLSMEWGQISDGVLRLEPGKSKGGEGRSVSLDNFPALKAVFDRQREYTDAAQRETGTIIPHVFHRNGGRPIKTMRQAFNAAAVRAGLEGHIPHDLRRSAARSMDRAGLPRSVSMQLMGLKTENVFTRYAIVTRSDLDSGAAKLSALHEQHPEARRSRTIGRKKA